MTDHAFPRDVQRERLLEVPRIARLFQPGGRHNQIESPIWPYAKTAKVSPHGFRPLRFVGGALR